MSVSTKVKRFSTTTIAAAILSVLAIGSAGAIIFASNPGSVAESRVTAEVWSDIDRGSLATMHRSVAPSTQSEVLGVTVGDDVPPSWVGMYLAEQRPETDQVLGVTVGDDVPPSWVGMYQAYQGIDVDETIGAAPAITMPESDRMAVAAAMLAEIDQTPASASVIPESDRMAVAAAMLAEVDQTSAIPTEAIYTDLWSWIPVDAGSLSGDDGPRDREPWLLDGPESVGG